MNQGTTGINPLDAAWLFVESDATPMHVGCVQIFEASKNSSANYGEQLYEELLRQTHCAPPFCLRMHREGLGMPRWEHLEEVDLEYHVQRWALPRPGDEERLNSLVAQLHSEALDMHKPLWEFHLIEGLQDNRLALFIKIHHSLMDGIGGMRLLQNMLASDPETACAAPWSAEGALGRMDLIDKAGQDKRRGFVQGMRTIVEQLKSLPEVSGSLSSLAWAGLHKHSQLQAPYTAPSCILNKKVGHERRFDTLRVPLPTMRQIAHHAGVSINDVLLSCCAGGLRKYLQSIDALPDEPLLAGLPVSVRPQGDTHIGTAVSFVMADLATDEAEALERLQRIHASTRAAKAHLAGMDKEALTEYTLLMMAPYMTELLTGLAGRVTPAFNLIISNVPGPEKPLYFNGAKMQAMYPLSIVTHGQALNITVVGYQDELLIGLTACKNTLPKLSVLRDAMLTEFQQLETWRLSQN